MKLTERLSLAWRLVRIALAGDLGINADNVGSMILIETTRYLDRENERLTKENIELRVRVEQLTIAAATAGSSPYRHVKPS